ncbi:SH3 domain-containing protein [Pseudovibrio sp. WM33]|uniref:SH3 domain-containing protein n=1 Tax=Pseudovibrio sp. WM33 TaxID=1735585 RepID=UPI0007B18ECF|nr:SH3 domain-containing protein [Pseudovibrio sp. WM33]KZL27087.1 Bacterial SH3 domain protein [Pseudovibrio sp. WM33]
MPKLTNLMCALILAGSFVALPVTSQALVRTLTSANTTSDYWLNLRQGPSTSYNVVRVLRPGSTVMVKSCQSDWRWCAVSYNGVDGYVNARYIHKDGVHLSTGQHYNLVPVSYITN